MFVLIDHMVKYFQPCVTFSKIVDLAIFGHNFEISAYKTEHNAHLLKRAHGQLDRDNPHPHLAPWDEKKIMEQKSWQRALRALHEDYHQS